MKTIITTKNPFNANRYGFLWEKLKGLKPGKHLDYGAYDGKVLENLIETNVIKRGVGVDINREIVEKSKDHLPKRILLKAITKNNRLQFQDNYFDTVSILDVIEHIYDQEFILLEIYRVLKAGGKIIITVPGKHIFSFLDMGNFKFLFATLHKYYYQLRYSKEVYIRRYVNNKNGLFGDIEIEKMWHQHFSKSELEALLIKCGFIDVQFDGSSLFTRPLLYFIWIPFIKILVRKLIYWDEYLFESMNLFAVASKR